jgi:hypothetical protein
MKKKNSNSQPPNIDRSHRETKHTQTLSSFSSPATSVSQSTRKTSLTINHPKVSSPANTQPEIPATPTAAPSTESSSSTQQPANPHPRATFRIPRQKNPMMPRRAAMISCTSPPPGTIASSNSPTAPTTIYIAKAKTVRDALAEGLFTGSWTDDDDARPGKGGFFGLAPQAPEPRLQLQQVGGDTRKSVVGSADRGSKIGNLCALPARFGAWGLYLLKLGTFGLGAGMYLWTSRWMTARS